MRTRLVPITAVALLLVGTLSACSSGSGGASGTSAGGSAADLQSTEGRVASASGASAATKQDRAVVTTATLRLVSDHPIAAADRIEAIVATAGGLIASSTEEPGSRASADLTVRIPAAEFETTLGRIREQGEVRDLDVRSTDVTARVTDYGVRIANLRTSIARLQDLLAKATTSAALVEIEGALTDRQTSLEQLLAEQRTLADQVTYATLDVAVVVPAAAPAKGPQDFLGGLAAGWQGFTAFAAALAIGTGVVLPWAVLLGALGAAAAVVVRVARRRARTA